MSEKAKILFVDDEENIVNTLKSLFKNTYEVYTATNGSAALGIIKNNQIHVIISDQRMPEMQGIDLLREVKEISPNTMRIMLTGYSDLPAIISSINVGEIFRYICKPWNNKDVKDTLNEAASIGLTLADNVSEPDQDIRLGHATDTKKIGLLVIDDELEIHATVSQLFSDKCKVVSALNYEESLDILEREDIGVIVSDVFVDNRDVTQFIKILKYQHPLIVTVILTRFRDANTTISLINQGQVFRYLPKPVHKGQLRASIEASLSHYSRCKWQPVLLTRHRVERAAVNQNPAMTVAIMARLKFLHNSIRT